MSIRTLKFESRALDDMTSIEMHCHTVHSDGVLTVSELLNEAARCGLTHIAITDHDSVGGYEEAKGIVSDIDANNAVDEKIQNMRIIPGVEISTRDGERDVHVLGYFIDVRNPMLLQTNDASRNGRRNRSVKIIEKLASDGFEISVDQLESQGLVLNRSNIARELERVGAVEHFEDAFDTLIGRGCPYYVEREDISPQYAVKVKKHAGGIAVIAHPAHYHVIDLIDPLCEVGLDGVECYHSEQTPEESEMLVRMARSRGLIVTGGSDFHGDAVHPSVLGGNQPPMEDVERFLEIGRMHGCKC